MSANRRADVGRESAATANEEYSFNVYLSSKEGGQNEEESIGEEMEDRVRKEEK